MSHLKVPHININTLANNEKALPEKFIICVPQHFAGDQIPLPS